MPDVICLRLIVKTESKPELDSNKNSVFSLTTRLSLWSTWSGVRRRKLWGSSWTRSPAWCRHASATSSGVCWRGLSWKQIRDRLKIQPFYNQWQFGSCWVSILREHSIEDNFILTKCIILCCLYSSLRYFIIISNKIKIHQYVWGDKMF